MKLSGKLSFTTGIAFLAVCALGGQPRALAQCGVKSHFENKQLGQRHQAFKQTFFLIQLLALDETPGQNYQAYTVGRDDKGNNIASKKHKAAFINPYPGKYTFKVTRSNQYALLRMVDLHPYWKTSWAYLFCLAVLITLAWVLIKLMLSRISQAQKQRSEHAQRSQVEDLSKAKMQFFLNISRELSIPLTLMLAPLEQIIKNRSLTYEVQGELNLVYHNAGKLHELVNELMDFTKPGHTNSKLNIYQYDIVQFASDLFSIFAEEAAHRQINYIFVCEDFEIWAWFDKSRMEKAIVNLISNAFNYTSNGGSIQLCIEQSGTGTQLPDDAKVRIAVIDNGSGIAEADLSRVFDPFFQRSENATGHNAGAGIGLTLVKNIVELHNGAVYVTSEKWLKTCFVVEIPLRIDPFNNFDFAIQPLRHRAPLSLNLRSPKAKKEELNVPLILIAEDDFALKAYLVSALSENYRVIEAANGNEAYEISLRYLPDVIISDVLMPHCNGIALCKKIKSTGATAHIPVILLTATTSIADQLQGMTSGADTYLTKPLSIDILKAHISQLVTAQQHLRAPISQDSHFSHQNQTLNTEQEEFLKKATDYVLKNLSCESSLGVESMSEALNLSRSNLFRKVKSATGKSVIDFIRAIKLKEAIKLMESGKHSIAEVAYLTGFKSPAYFTKSFKEQYGKSPSGFLKKTAE